MTRSLGAPVGTRYPQSRLSEVLIENAVIGAMAALPDALLVAGTLVLTSGSVRS